MIVGRSIEGVKSIFDIYGCWWLVGSIIVDQKLSALVVTESDNVADPSVVPINMLITLIISIELNRRKLCSKFFSQKFID